MVKPPFKANHGASGIWIEDADGLTVADMNPLIDPEMAIVVAGLLANGTNEYLRRVEHAREIGKKGGRPPKKLNESSKKSIKKARRK